MIDLEWIKFVLKKWKAATFRDPRPSWSRLAVLDRYGITPRTVFDIGVAHGTFELYRMFPAAAYILIDPTPGSLRHMQRLAKSLVAQIYTVALTDRDGPVELDVRADIQGSTLFADVHPGHVRNLQQVEGRRFDSLFPNPQPGPVLVKIDVQGAELAVLRGMGDAIKNIDAFVIEVSTISSLEGGPEVAEIVGYLVERGFVVHDVIGIKHRPLDGATAQLDLFFVKVDSPARADRRWQQ